MTKSGRHEAKSNFSIEVSTIHDALAESRFKASRVPGENTTIRLDPHEKKLAMTILETNGATISDFLRHCIKALVRDYAGNQAVQSEVSDAG